MPKVKFIKGAQADIDLKEIENGQLLFATDTKKIYLDTVEAEEDVRIAVGGNSFTNEDIISGTIESENWESPQEVGELPYCEVEDDGIKENLYIVQMVTSASTTAALKDAWNKICQVKAEEGVLTFYCWDNNDLPSADLDFIAIPV